MDFDELGEDYEFENIFLFCTLFVMIVPFIIIAFPCAVLVWIVQEFIYQLGQLEEWKDSKKEGV